MSERVAAGAIKVIELVGISQENFEDAVQQAVSKASSSIDEIRGVEVARFSAKVNDNRITEFHANVKLAFVVK